MSWLDDVDDADLDASVVWLRKAARDHATVVVAAHVGPDGDALGAALALHLALSAAGANSLPTVGEEPLKIPAPLAGIPGVGDLVTGSALPPPSEVSLLVTVDAASPGRLGTARRYLDQGVPSIVLDHHASGTPFGDLRLVAPRAAATVQITAELLDRLELPITPEIATCLYVGLVTDTGRFGHAATDRAVMELAGRLLAVGVDHVELTRRLYDTRSLAELKLLGRALDRAVFVPDVALIHTHLTHDEVVAAGAGLEAVEALIDLLRSADVAEVALVLKPDPDGSWRASLRSGGTVDVGELATTFGGGGHAFAAGFSVEGRPEEIVAGVTTGLREG